MCESSVYVGYMSNVCSMLVFHLQDHKLKHMAELQQSVVTDQETRHQIQSQILQWEENLERLHCEQFRLRCYMASLQSGELPNPKVSNMFPTPTSPYVEQLQQFVRASGSREEQEESSHYVG